MSFGLGALEGARVLVTGGSGLIGRAVVSALVAQGARVLVLDRTQPEFGTFLSGDVCDHSDVAAAVQHCDVVIHLAGIPGLGFVDSVETYRINTVGTFTVLSAAADAQVAKVVYASSINAAGWPLNPGNVYPRSYPFSEETPATIGDWYSLSKKANEDAAAMLASRTSTQFTGLRYPLVRDIVGNPERFRQHLANLITEDSPRAAKEGWSYLDVSDAARATLAAAVSETSAAPGILLAAPRTFLSTPTDRALALSVPHANCASVAGTDVPIDLGRARSHLGFEARVLLQDVAPEALVRLETDVDE